MKKTRSVIVTTLIALLGFGAAVYTSCNKDRCSNVTCQNGGTCNNGSCTCPTGYTGANCQTTTTTSVAYVNNTFTPITLVINGITQTIPVGGSVSVKGYYGTIASGVAYTSGSTPLGVITGYGVVGETIYWQINDSYPKSGTTTNTLNVGASYFYLNIVNNHSLSITNYIVNNELTVGMLGVTATIPNNGQTYGLGYYLAYPNSNLVVSYSDGSKSTLSTLSLPFTNNQMYTASFN